ncbi:SHD1 domain-containing protein [Schlesneria sp. DSM 10557]|uniref:SHD1 domain-containing protein n=1 Tax=Schlesneria sp. DSM 10557 TaxID=3044399 RepID=UPI0035A0473A
MRTCSVRNACLASFVWLFVLLSLSPTPVMSQDDYRTWSDSTGKNKIKARFIKVEDDVVTLEKQDGDEVEIELKKLSSADQKFVSNLQKEEEDSPFKTKRDDPFKSKSSGKKPASGKASADDSGGPRTVTVDLSGVEQISLAATGEPWKLDIVAPESSPAATRLKSIPLPSKTNFFEGLKGMAISRGTTSKFAVVGYLLDKHGEGGTIRVAICDLKTGKCGTPAVGVGKMVPIALHDDGQQIIMRREEFGFGNQDRLEVWIPKGNKVTKKVSWTPYEADQGAARDVLWAEFVNAETLATSSRDGKVVLWKFPEIEPVCQFDTANGAVPALSPDRKWIAFSNGSDVGVFDIEKQEVVAIQQTPTKLQWPYMAFSPTCQKLACLAFDKVLVWNLATGELERTIPCTGLNVHGSIEFPDDAFVLVGNHYLLDLQNQLKLWTYEGAEQVRSADGITYFAVTEGEKKAGALVPLQIPHPAAKTLLKKALTDPDLFVLREGTTVKIDVSGIPDATQRDRVVKGLTRQLEAIGCKAGANGSINLLASVEGPKDTEINFIAVGTYKFKEYVSQVKFTYRDQPVWHSAQTNAPGIVQLQKGENMDSHLRAREKPSYEFFENVQLPKFLQKPSAGQGPGHSLTLGQSKVSTTGIR